jgi:hypothetical protein
MRTGPFRQAILLVVEMEFANISKEGWIMRRWIFLAMLLLAGCQNTMGPLANSDKERPDQPQYNIPQQQYLGRDRYPLPQDSFSTGPATGVNNYGPTNR